MLSQQNIAGQHSRSLPEGANPDPPSELPASPNAPHILEPGLGINQKEPDINSGLEPSKGKICGMKRKIFMIVLGVIILLIIAVAAGVGGGVAGSNAHSGASESKKPNPQDSSTPTDPPSSPTSSGSHPAIVTSIVTVTPSISSSPSPTPIRKNSPLAAVNWGTSDIQLFYKHTDGTIKLREKSGFNWGEQSPQITKPKDDSGLAAIGWLEGDVRQVRVYTADGNNALIESFWNSSAKLWSDQDISTNREIAPLAAGSHLTAFTWFENKTLHIHVYYQGQDGYIREAVFEGKSWSKGGAPTIEDFPRAKSGTGLAIVSFPDTHEREAKLFYQSMDGRLVSYDYKPAATWVESWKNQDPNYGSIPDGAQVAAVTTRFGAPAPGGLALRIYFIHDGKLVELWRGKGWSSWHMRKAAAPGAAAVYYSDNVNVFFQDKTEYLSALSLNRVVNKWEFTPII